MDEESRSRRGAALRARLAVFIVTIIVAVLLLTLMGAPVLAILYVFGLAIILAISALLMTKLVMSGRLVRKK